VLVSKYADHLQAQIFAQQGITLDRSTLAAQQRPVPKILVTSVPRSAGH
jgi:hypothetical protein